MGILFQPDIDDDGRRLVRSGSLLTRLELIEVECASGHVGGSSLETLSEVCCAIDSSIQGSEVMKNARTLGLNLTRRSGGLLLVRPALLLFDRSGFIRSSTEKHAGDSVRHDGTHRDTTSSRGHL